MHFGGVELARGRLAPVFFNRSVILSEMVSPQEAVTAGFLDKVVCEAEFALICTKGTNDCSGYDNIRYENPSPNKTKSTSGIIARARRMY